MGVQVKDIMETVSETVAVEMLMTISMQQERYNLLVWVMTEIVMTRVDRFLQLPEALT